MNTNVRVEARNTKAKSCPAAVNYRLMQWFTLALLLGMSVLSAGCASTATKSDNSAELKNAYALFDLRQDAGQAYQQSRWIEAVKLYQSLVEQAPGDSDAWFKLGNIYAQQGAFQRAIHAYEESLTHDADQPKAWFNLSTAYLLNAQSAMRNSHSQLRSGDPAKRLIEERLYTLDALVHGRFEEGVTPAHTRAGSSPARSKL